MTRQELQKALDAFPADTEVMILDGFNGGGTLRTLNLGPTSKTITELESDDTADCEGRHGEVVVALGYGCY